MIDVMEYIIAREEQLDPPRVLSREAMVMLALADNYRSVGFCSACNVKLDNAPRAEWCDECESIRRLFSHNADACRARANIKLLSKCIDCGKQYRQKTGGGRRCPLCQHEAKLAYRRKWYAKRQEAMS